MKKITQLKWFIPVVMVVLCVLTAATVLAVTGGWPVSHNVTGSGTVTVTTAPPTSTITTPVTTPSTYDFSVSPTTIDFSGTATSGDIYTKTITLTITNNSITGTDGGATTVTSITAAAIPGPSMLTSLPIGWTCTGTYSGSIVPGASDTMNITISSVNPVTTTTNLNFTIQLTASGS
jgi:hypothetical protein